MKNSFEARKKVLYDFICDPLYVPMKIKEIAIVLNIPKENRAELNALLDSLIADGKISLSKRGKYTKAAKVLIEGRFVSNPRGFGFVEVDGMEEDIFISPDDINFAMHDDTVQVQLTRPAGNGKSAEGRVVKIVEHGITRVIGTYQNNGGFGFVVSDNPKFSKDVFVTGANSREARNGQKVLVELTDYGTNGRKPEGKVVEILGMEGDKGVDILSVIRAYDLPEEFPEKVENQAERVAKPVSEADMNGRLDLRDVMMVTIDGEDAKDLDDAVSLSKNGDVYELGVHIADVTNYVQEHSALDEEAKKRGTSVYLVDRVIPMLPRTLSNGMCSLNHDEDRLALSCLMTIDKSGKVISHQIAETVINVNKRMNYSDVWKVLSEDPDADETYMPYKDMLVQMRELADILRHKRMNRGSIDFDFPETKITLDENGIPREIGPYERNSAHKLIEDFMLIANETVAEDSFWQEMPFVYRSHANPDPEKIKSLSAFINNFGYSLHIRDDEVHPKELQKLLAKVEGTDEEALIARLCLRSMQQARYTTEAIGHFGLAATYYCHFTSPIRRYPDLIIHRIIKENLRGRLNEDRKKHYNEILDEIAKHSSQRERIADEAERETDKIKMCEYMSYHTGEEFDGVISGVMQYGFFVELKNTVEGLVHVSTLYDDDYMYDQDKFELMACHSDKSYKLGQKVRVRVKATDMRLHTVDFVLAEEDADE